MIRALYFDYFGKRTGASEESAADFSAMLPKRPPSTVPQVADELKGTQRRPARKDTRFE